MEVKLKRIDQDFHFEAVGTAGVAVHMDGSPDIGGHNAGARPMEMILMGLAGCSAIDIVLILRKSKQQLDDMEITVKAQRVDAIPAVFEKIHLTFFMKGEIKQNKAEQAVSMSVEKYCSVAKMLSHSVEITWEVVIN